MKQNRKEDDTIAGAVVAAVTVQILKPGFRIIVPFAQIVSKSVQAIGTIIWKCSKKLGARSSGSSAFLSGGSRNFASGQMETA